ncbi:MAG: hypothetical protein R3E46_17645 [Sedimenticolaceae bacterium]
MSDEVCARYAGIAELASAIARLAGRSRNLVDAREVALQEPEDAMYRLERDPYSGTESLVGEWRDECGMKRGELKFHADGTFFVEQDVTRVHPRRAHWFVEGVTAWGRDHEIRSEATLLPMPDD